MADLLRITVTALLTVEIMVIPITLRPGMLGSKWLVLAMGVLLIGRWHAVGDHWNGPIVWWGAPLTCVVVLLLGIHLLTRRRPRTGQRHGRAT